MIVATKNKKMAQKIRRIRNCVMSIVFSLSGDERPVGAGEASEDASPALLPDAASYVGASRPPRR
jgi:hypothetical protein